MVNSAADNTDRAQPVMVGNPMLSEIKDFLDDDSPIESVDLPGFAVRSLRGREKQVAMLIVGVMTLAATCCYLTVSPLYQSIGLIRVLAREQKILYADSDDSRLRLYDAFVSVEMQLLQSRPVLDAALADLRLQHDRLGALPGNVDELAKILQVSNKKGLVSIISRSGDALLSAAVVNAVLTAYEASNEAARYRQYEVRRRGLSTRESELRNLLTTLNARYLEIGAEHDVNTLSKAHVAKTAHLEVLEERIVELDNTIVQLQTTGGVGADVGSVEIQRATLLDRASADMAYERVRRLAKLETMRRRYRPSHPRLLSAELELKSIETGISERRQLITTLGNAGALTGGMGGTTQRSLDELIGLKSKLVARRQSLRGEANDLNFKRIRIRSVVTEQTRVGRLLEETKRALDEILVESHNDLTRSIVVVARGQVADRPSEDKRKPMALASAVFGGIGVFFSVVTGTQLRGRINFSDDLDSRMNSLLAGVVPDVSSLHEPLETVTRQLRNEFDLRWPSGSDEPLVVGIVGTSAGVGVTSLVCAMAKTYSAANRNVLLIDADVNEAGLTNLYEQPQASGLTQMANAGVTLGDTVRQLAADSGSMYLLPAGFITERSTAAGYVPEMSVEDTKNLLRAARDEYDIILVDLGILAAGRQSAVGAALVDRVVMVVASGDSKSLVNGAFKLLERLAPDRVLLLFNRAKSQDPAFRDGLITVQNLARNIARWTHRLTGTLRRQ